MANPRILAPIDYTHASRRALKYALDMADREGAELTILHVCTLPNYVSPTLAVMIAGGQSSVTLEDLTKEQGEAGMKAFLAEADVPVARVAKVEVLMGDPVTVILDRLKEHDIGVVGTHGRTGLDHVFMGSVAERLVRNASKPIITVRSRTKRPAIFPPKRILVPVDFSDGARHALQIAQNMATTDDATVELIHVLDSFPAFEGTEALVIKVAGDDPKPYETHAREEAARSLQLFLTGSFEGVPPNLTVEVGNTDKVIIGHAVANDIDLIVMGTHGRSGWRRLGIGSVAERVLRTSEVPVLTVREAKSE